MKTIKSLIIFILLSTAVCAQNNSFTLPVELSQGFVFDNYHNPQLYQVSISASPTYSLMRNKAHVSGITMALFSNGLTDYYIGSGLAYTIFQKNNYNIQLMASALAGTRNKQLYGGGVKVESGDWFITAQGRQEYSKKEFYFTGGLGVVLF